MAWWISVFFHADALHDGKVPLIFVTFGNLLVVNDQNRCTEKYKGYQTADEEQTGIGTLRIFQFFCIGSPCECSVFPQHSGFFGITFL